VADIDAALGQQALDLARGGRMAHVRDDSEADDRGRTGEMPEGG